MYFSHKVHLICTNRLKSPENGLSLTMYIPYVQTLQAHNLDCLSQVCSVLTHKPTVKNSQKSQKCTCCCMSVCGQLWGALKASSFKISFWFCNSSIGKSQITCLLIFKVPGQRSRSWDQKQWFSHFYWWLKYFSLNFHVRNIKMLDVDSHWCLLLG